jgi:hypothetical protein
MNAHYEAVLADLKQMKADAEAGIAAIERLMTRGEGGKVDVGRTSKSGAEDGSSSGFHVLADAMEMSVPQRIGELLGAQPSKSFTIAELVEGTGVKNVQTLRGALIRMVALSKAVRTGRGRYRAPRPKPPQNEGSA